jgi:mRNA-degrading endonuclease RelE of RelBE toxin-antitoxin system
MTWKVTLSEEDSFRPRPNADILLIRDTEPRKYRLRVGEYRAIYAVAGSEVKVIEVFARGRENI